MSAPERLRTMLARDTTATVLSTVTLLAVVLSLWSTTGANIGAPAAIPFEWFLPTLMVSVLAMIYALYAHARAIAVEEQFEDLKTEFDDVGSTVTSLDGDVSDLSTELANFAATMERFDGRLSALQDGLAVDQGQRRERESNQRQQHPGPQGSTTPDRSGRFAEPDIGGSTEQKSVEPDSADGPAPPKPPSSEQRPQRGGHASEKDFRAKELDEGGDSQ